MCSEPGRGLPRLYRWLGDGRPGGRGDGGGGLAVDEGGAPATTFVVREHQTDLWVAVWPPVDATRAASLCHRRVRAARAAITAYGRRRPAFFTSLAPLELEDEAGLPPETERAVVRAMLDAGLRVGVGPMAAVAGAVAEDAARFLREKYASSSVIVENGGDVYAFSPAPLTVAVLAGSSPLSGKAALRIPAAPHGISVCTSSGTVGPSFSRGKADAATALAANGALADALATELGNRVCAPEDVEAALAWLACVDGALGGAVVIGERMGLWGQLELTPTGA